MGGGICNANFCVQNCKLCKWFQHGHYEKVNLMISPTALLIYFVTFCWILGDFAPVLHMVKKNPNHYYLNKTIFENLFFWKKLIHFTTNIFHDWSAILFYGQIHGFDYIHKFPYFPMKSKYNPKVSIIMCTLWKFEKTKESFAPYIVKCKVHVTSWLSQYGKIANLKSRTPITPFLHHSYSNAK